MENNLVNAFIWKFLERIGTQGVQFLLQLFLARLLIPKDYGIVALVTIFIAVSNVFIQSGFNIALIQKKKIDNIDLSSTFYISFFIATILYIILWLISPFVSNFYKIPELVMVIRIMSLTLFLGALNSIQNAIIMRELAFKKLFFSSLIAIIVSGSSGIILAYKGVGIWALIFQQLLNQLLISVILLFILEWKPKLVFSLKRVKKLFSFGGKLLCSALIDTIYKELVNIIVGKIYSPIMLGYYNRGEQFPKVLVNNFNGTIQSVIFPTLASVQQDKMKVKEIMRKGIMISSYIIFPAMVGLMAISEPLIRLVLTEKWLPCVPYLRIFCLSYALWPIHTANLQAINAIGRSDIFLKLEIIKKFIGISIILITLKYNPYIMAIGTVFSGIISSFINSYPNKKLLNYSYIEQIKDIIPSISISVIMGVVTHLIQLLKYNDILTILLQIITGGGIYIILSHITKNESFRYLLEFIFKKRGKERC